MNHGPYFIPPGAPPGTPMLMEEERPPEAVYYFRIYAIVMILSLLTFFAWGLYLMLEPLMKRGGGSPSTGEWFIGAFMMGISMLFMVPHSIVLFGGRAKWVHTLATVLIGMSMLWNSCCLPITIPLLVVWMKPETKRWYGIY